MRETSRRPAAFRRTCDKRTVVDSTSNSVRPRSWRCSFGVTRLDREARQALAVCPAEHTFAPRRTGPRGRPAGQTAPAVAQRRGHWAWDRSRASRRNDGSHRSGNCPTDCSTACDRPGTKSRLSTTTSATSSSASGPTLSTSSSRRGNSSRSFPAAACNKRSRGSHLQAPCRLAIARPDSASCEAFGLPNFVATSASSIKRRALSPQRAL